MGNSQWVNRLGNELPATEEDLLGPRVRGHEKFEFTDAIRLAPNAIAFDAREGFRQCMFRDKVRKFEMPMLAAAVTRKHLFDVFLEMTKKLSPVVHVILETSHGKMDDTHDDLLREGIDLSVAQSKFCDYEDMLVNDGCTGVALLDEKRTMEVQFDEHKTLTVYGKDLTPFRRTLKRQGVPRIKGLRLITEVEHTHISRPRFEEEFARMAQSFAISEAEYGRS